MADGSRLAGEKESAGNRAGAPFSHSCLMRKKGLVRPLVEKLGVSFQTLRGVGRLVDSGVRACGAGLEIYPSASLRRVFTQAVTRSGAMSDEFVSTEHLLLALAESEVQFPTS